MPAVKEKENCDQVTAWLWEHGLKYSYDRLIKELNAHYQKYLPVVPKRDLLISYSLLKHFLHDTVTKFVAVEKLLVLKYVLQSVIGYSAHVVMAITPKTCLQLLSEIKILILVNMMKTHPYAIVSSLTKSFFPLLDEERWSETKKQFHYTDDSQKDFHKECHTNARIYVDGILFKYNQPGNTINLCGIVQERSVHIRKKCCILVKCLRSEIPSTALEKITKDNAYEDLAKDAAIEVLLREISGGLSEDSLLRVWYHFKDNLGVKFCSDWPKQDGQELSVRNIQSGSLKEPSKCLKVEQKQQFSRKNDLQNSLLNPSLSQTCNKNGPDSISTSSRKKEVAELLYNPKDLEAESLGDWMFNNMAIRRESLIKLGYKAESLMYQYDLVKARLLLNRPTLNILKGVEESRLNSCKTIIVEPVASASSQNGFSNSSKCVDSKESELVRPQENVNAQQVEETGSKAQKSSNKVKEDECVSAKPVQTDSANTHAVAVLKREEKQDKSDSVMIGRKYIKSPKHKLRRRKDHADAEPVFLCENSPKVHSLRLRNLHREARTDINTVQRSSGDIRGKCVNGIQLRSRKEPRLALNSRNYRDGSVESENAVVPVVSEISRNRVNVSLPKCHNSGSDVFTIHWQNRHLGKRYNLRTPAKKCHEISHPKRLRRSKQSYSSDIEVSSSSAQDDDLSEFKAVRRKRPYRKILISSSGSEDEDDILYSPSTSESSVIESSEEDRREKSESLFQNLKSPRTPVVPCIVKLKHAGYVHKEKVKGANSVVKHKIFS